ncbi:MAG: hypothetical protein U0M51_01225 [Eggerthellaceae bacterium]
MGTPALITAFVVLLLTIAVIAIVAVCKSRQAAKLEEILESRKNVVNAITLITLAIGVNLAIGIWGNSLSQEQIAIEEREAAPLLKIGVTHNDSNNTYVIENQKGIASYLSLSVAECYTFYWNGETREINVTFETQPKQDLLSISKGESISFDQETYSFDADEMEAALGFYLKETYDADASVSRSRNIELSFRDNNNPVTLCYLEADDDFELSRTDYRHIPEKNVFHLNLGFQSEWEIAESLLESVMD